MSGIFICRRFRREEFVSIGGVGWWMDVAEEDVGGRKMMEQDFSAEKVFFGQRPVLGRCGNGSEKDVRTRKIVECQRREAKIE